MPKTFQKRHLSKVLNPSGQASLVGLVAALLISTTCGFYFFSGLKYDGTFIHQHQEKMLAEAHMTELLEFFRSFSIAQLRAYVKTRFPTTPYCTPIGFFSSGSTPMPTPIPPADPIAVIFSNLNSTAGLLNPVRFYEVRIVDSKSQLSIGDFQCGQTATALAPIAQTQTYEIKVTVRWTPQGVTTDNTGSVFATTYLTREQP